MVFVVLGFLVGTDYYVLIRSSIVLGRYNGGNVGGELLLSYRPKTSCCLVLLRDPSPYAMRRSVFPMI